tara:strand:- start:281 stop:583 length:303 start_codon:yes stop_codon:yes gene_type:complete
MHLGNIILGILCSLVIMVFMVFPSKAQTYNEAVLGHIITENIRGGIDNNAVMEAELQRAAYLFAIQSINILESYLPSILDGVKRDMQIVAEEKYKDVLSD